MAARVPGHSRYPVAESYAVLAESLGDAYGTCPDRLVVRRVDGPIDRACNDTALRVVKGRVVDDTMTEQWPVLHQSKHERSPDIVVSDIWRNRIGATTLYPTDNTNNLLQRRAAKKVFFS